MTREVNREYWQEYFDTYNSKRYDDIKNWGLSLHPCLFPWYLLPLDH